MAKQPDHSQHSSEEAIADLCKVLVLQEFEESTAKYALPQLTHEIRAAAFASLMRLGMETYHHNMAKARHFVEHRKQELESELRREKFLEELKNAVKHLDAALSSYDGEKPDFSPAPKINSTDKRKKKSDTVETELSKLEGLTEKLKANLSPHRNKRPKLG
ncbi:hypothetical protein A1O3_07368 [Capronia epimyces CBS 606.96]|uniref:Uncharacterized protein n=1 Tax=Capronia epimyces CBS 606.96 TaxID=1182542 RepID=W9XUQ8_9EURO|nr:uncharacterized protein A1O3_07368 [Capronia epimyces CBS 606.96]EXJ81080.1 hypothetical protein A1O3_07368 [Capronia epimyces CBS 606.96]